MKFENAGFLVAANHIRVTGFAARPARLGSIHRGEAVTCVD